MQNQIAHNEQELKDLDVDWEQRLAQAKSQWEKEHSTAPASVPSSEPYLTNVNEDTQV